MGLFSNIGQQKEIVYLSVTPGVGLEIIQLDYSSRSVKNYSCRPLEYKESMREIADIELFKTSVEELFSDLRLNVKGSNIILNLPLVLLGNKDLPLILADDAVNEALLSEVEQSYVFKRSEPLISWYDTNTNQTGDSRKLFYSAIQKNVVEEIKNAFSELGANLVGIDISLTSVLKALDFAGVAQEQLKEGITWNLMLITQNGYSICSMVGKHLVDYYEEPLAIKSFVKDDDIYDAINASAQIALLSYPANYLYIISETDMVSAEVLSAKLNADCVKIFLENNDFKKNDVIPVSLEVLDEMAHKVSLEAIGIAAGAAVNSPVQFNFFGSSAAKISSFDNPDELVHVVLGSTEFDITPNQAKLYSIIIAAILVVPLLLLFFALPMLINGKQAKLDEINSKKQGVDAEISKISDSENSNGNFDINAEIKNVLGYNRAKLMAYMALGESVPKKLWLTYFVAKDNDKFDIKGESSNVEDVYAFYKNMKDSLINTQLRLHNLKLKSNSVDDAVMNDITNVSDYEFEVTNMDAASLDNNTDEDAPKEENSENN